jgi:hypothetical protein
MPDASFPAKVERFTEGPFKGEPKTFVCDECGMTRTVGRGGLRGYGVRTVERDGLTNYVKVCYDCCAQVQRGVPCGPLGRKRATREAVPA